MDLTLRQLQYFVTTAEAGTMTAAAKQMFVSQSAVSLAISDLEEHLGVQLMLRQNPKQLALTQAGRQVLVDARRVLAGVEELQSDARAEGTSIAGTLHVGCYRTLGPFVLPKVIEGFEQKYPDVRVAIVEDGTDELCASLVKGEIEVAILYNLEVPTTVELIHVDSISPYLLVAPSHRLAKGATISAQALNHEDLILFAPPAEYYLHLLRSMGVEPRVRYKSANFETVRSITARGMGYALFHQRPVIEASYEGRQLCIREFEEEVPKLDMVLAQARGQKATRRARAFIDYCRHTMRSTHVQTKEDIDHK